MLIKSCMLFALLGFFNTLAYSSASPQENSNKETVIAFYNQAFNNKDYNAAATYIGTPYTQHNPLVTNDREGLKTFIEFLRTNYPNSHSEIKRVFADGDFVILQVHSVRTPGSPGRAIFDLFKLKNGKIMEHWDAIQDIPPTSANNNTMF